MATATVTHRLRPWEWARDERSAYIESDGRRVVTLPPDLADTHLQQLVEAHNTAIRQIQKSDAT